MARHYGVAIVMAGDWEYPQIADVTAPFVYARVMGTKSGEALGYSRAVLERWAKRARVWAEGGTPGDLEAVGGGEAAGKARTGKARTGKAAAGKSAPKMRLQRERPRRGRSRQKRPLGEVCRHHRPRCLSVFHQWS